MKNRVLLLTLTILMLGLLAPETVRADEPTPGVARVSLINGDVSTMRGDSGDWVATTVNTPLVAGDRIATGARSRTEIQLDYANVMRLAQRSEAKIADLTRTQMQIQLASGLMDLTVLKGSEANVEIDTPNMAVRPLGEGVYRIQVNSASETELIVRNGEAEVTTPQGSTTVKKNDVIYVQGTESPEYRIASAPGKDEWDQWNRERDDQIADARSYRYANRYYTGANDLDRYGRWEYVPDYDWCWVPYVNAGWVPYRDGRWIWEPYWGWTWVSYEPWGWAPYHYGRWFWWGSSWAWWPGQRYYGFYPTWAPAYVSFLGFGFGGRNWGFGFGFGFNSIGWCPLGPYDTFHPWWGWRNSYNVVNITNITNVTNVQNGTNVNIRRMVGGRERLYTTNLQTALTNYNVRRAITTVPTQDFINGRIPRNVQTVNPNVLRTADVVRGTLPVVPTKASLAPVNRPANRANLPGAAVNNERFFTRRPTPSAPTRNFSTEAAQIQRMVETHNPVANTRQTFTGQAGTNAERLGNNGRAQTGQMAGALNTRQNVGRDVQPQTARLTPNSTAGRPGPGAANPSERAVTPEVVRPGSAVKAPQQQGQMRTNARAPEQAASRPDNQMRVTVQGGERPSQAAAPNEPGWQRFGTGNNNRQRSPVTANLMSENQQGRTAPAASQARPAAPAQQENQNGWRKFNSQPRPGSEVGRAAPSRTAPGQAAPTGTIQSRPAVSPQGGEQKGWQRFNQQARPAPSQGNSSVAAPRSQQAAPGWNRFTPRTESAPAQGRGQWNAPAPRSEPGSSNWNRFPSRSTQPRYERAPSQRYERPPLELNKPIVRERPSRSRTSEGSGYRGSSRPSWGASSRGYSSSSSRSYSAPSGGGRSYSAPAARSSGGSRGRH